jgi:hypothetical protein
MSWVITAIVVAGAGTAKLQHDAGKAQQIEFNRQAEEEKIGAEGRELQRRQQLNDVLASNIASLSSSGISGEGTPQSISLENAKQASLSEGMLSLSDKLKQAQLRRQGAAAKRQGNVQAASTLLNTGTQAARLG